VQFNEHIFNVLFSSIIWLSASFAISDVRLSTVSIYNGIFFILFSVDLLNTSLQAEIKDDLKSSSPME
jgi:hypothetical protein